MQSRYDIKYTRIFTSRNIALATLKFTSTHTVPYEDVVSLDVATSTTTSWNYDTVATKYDIVVVIIDVVDLDDDDVGVGVAVRIGGRW